MSTILFDPYTGIGHVTGTIKLAGTLRDNGHRVLYTGNNKVCEPAIRKGFGFVLHNPYFKSIEEVQKSIDRKYSLFESISNAITGSSFKIFLKYVDEFKSIIREISPDVVILDEENILKYFIYKALEITVISVQTMPDKHREVNIPPFTFRFCPIIGSKFSKSFVTVLWWCKIVQNYLDISFRTIKRAYQDNYSFSQKVIKQLGFRFIDEFSFESSYSFCLKRGLLLVLSPADFDFPRLPRHGTFLLGPLKDYEEEHSKILSPRFDALCKHIAEWRFKKIFIVFCSLGTNTLSEEKRVTVFFIKMRKVALMNPDIRFIFSTGDNFEIDKLYPLPTNVTAFPFLPQSTLLLKSDLMITHGGMNSITECVFSEVPMIVYPLSPRWDQPGNSARIVFHKLGLRGRLLVDSPKTITKKIKHIRDNYLLFSQSVKYMKEKFAHKNNSQDALSIIESFITTPWK
jgi:zeaxanthin glucosyltransferase